MVNLLHVSSSKYLVVICQVKAIDFIDESWVLLKITSERLAKLQ